MVFRILTTIPQVLHNIEVIAKVWVCDPTGCLVAFQRDIAGGALTMSKATKYIKCSEHHTCFAGEGLVCAATELHAQANQRRPITVLGTEPRCISSNQQHKQE
jgi:hypothetical protein